MKTIPLTKGLVTLVDDEDFDFLNQFKWYAQKAGRQNYYYAARNRSRKETGPRVIYMHSLLCSHPGFRTDHQDRNTLNNQKSNLRLATHPQNLWNRTAQKNSASGIKGVSWRADRKKWVVRLKIGDNYKHIGNFGDQVLAIAAYNNAAACAHGQFAVLQ